MNPRYREFLESAPSRCAARHRLVRYARARGVRAAAAMSGASLNTVRRLLRRVDAGTLVPRRIGSPRLSLHDEARIVDAKLAHPEAGVMRLKREHGLPYGNRQILRALREAGLRTRRPDFAPERRLRTSERRLLAARLELEIAEAARAWNIPGRVAEVERIRRRLMIAERMVRHWRKRLRDLASHPNPPAAPGGPNTPAGPDTGSPPSPDDADYLEHAAEGELRADGSAGALGVLGDYGARVEE